MPDPPNQTCATAIAVTSLPFAVTVNTTAAGDSPATPDDNCGSGNSYNSVWYTWIAPTGTTVLRFNIDDADGEALVTVFSGACGSLVDTTYCTCCHHSTVMPVVEGTQYYFMITSYDPGGVVAATFSLGPTGTFCAVLDCGGGGGTGTIVVTKITTPSPDPTTTTFHFIAGGLSPASFSLIDGATETFTDVAVGDGHSVTEVPATLWTTTYQISNGSPHTNISVAANEVVTVHVLNAYTGNLNRGGCVAGVNNGSANASKSCTATVSNG